MAPDIERCIPITRWLIDCRAILKLHYSGMAKIKSERHHWWPECLSQYWKDEDGCASWLLPSGEIKRMPPKNLGVIGNGHHIKLSNNPEEETVWDTSFESEFQKADDNFPAIVSWLEGLADAATPSTSRIRFKGHDADDEKIALLVEGLVSLAVRSPMNRERAVALAEHYRGPLPSRERNSLIGMNMRNTQREATKAIGTRGKFVVIFSPDKEFIFGDGFFHNIRSPGSSLSGTKICAPLTPRMAVLHVRPSSYHADPRLMTYVATAEDALLLNHAVQVYAKNAIFFRREQPVAVEAFMAGKHLQYSTSNNPIDNLIEHIPGIEKRNRSMEAFLEALADSADQQDSAE